MRLFHAFPGNRHKRFHPAVAPNGLIAKGESSPCAKATSFASHIIKLGTYTDENPEEKKALDTFRKLAKRDFVEVELFFKSVVGAN